jgi:hypothetical protein
MQGQVIERLVTGIAKLTKRMRRQAAPQPSIGSPAAPPQRKPGVELEL